MLSSLKIRGYRGLSELHISQLGRVNLIVGENNCGKTSILEAVHQLVEVDSIHPLYEATVRRGELVDTNRNSVSGRYRHDLTHVFFGHELTDGTTINLEGESSEGRMNYSIQVEDERLAQRQLDFSPNQDDDVEDQQSSETGPPLQMQIRWNTHSVAFRLIDGCTDLRRVPLSSRQSDRPRSVLISTSGLSQDDVASQLSSVILQPEEEFLYTALHTIDSTIDRLALVGDYRRSADRSRVVLRCTGVKHRVPIGSMGDGIWRILGVALAMVTAKGGYLLIDEIDTGLHYTVMERMWRLVAETARRLNVQVFATTHSRDCVESLGAIAREDAYENSEIMIHRIERTENGMRAVSMSEAVVHAVSEYGTEVR